MQKIALKSILSGSYISYDNALTLAKLHSLADRRQQLSLEFARSCTKSKKTATMFPLNPSNYVISTRERKVYYVQKASTGRLQRSAIPYTIYVPYAKTTESG